MNAVVETPATIAKRIKEHIERGDKAKDKADQHYAAAGLLLKQLKGDCSSKAEWERLIKARCGIGTTRAYQLIEIADGRKTVADVRLGTAKRMRKHAAANKAARQEVISSVTDGQNKAAEPAAGADEEGVGYAIGGRRVSRQKAMEALRQIDAMAKDGTDVADEGDGPQQFWERSLSNHAGDAVALEAMWTRQHGAAWRDFPVSPDLVTLAREAAAAWTSLAEQLAARAAPATEAKAPVPEPKPVVETNSGADPWADYPDLPAACNRAQQGAADESVH
jgi:hypothetical protein